MEYDNPIIFSDEQMKILRSFREGIEEQLKKPLTTKEAILIAVNDYIDRME